jgi:thioredoxin-like negative regulator of GroEL
MAIFGSSGAGRPAPSGAGGGKQPSGPSAVTQVTEREFEAEVIRSELPVLIQFFLETSAPCRALAPEVEAFARENQGKVKVVKVDVQKAPLLARELRVQSVPTFMVFAEQRISDAAVGAISKKKMQQMVEPFLPRAAGALKPVELAELAKEGAVVPVDTREPAAYARAHIPGAVNMPFEEIEGRLAELHMMAGQPVLYCRSGDKTKDLAATLAAQEVPVSFLEGGLLAWESDGLPVKRP